ncbi:CNT_collapsed_G0016000.mRNA.1.CDS.1 [Saccharomyces cerevisiae]|nr:CNT_collapsed_G0016000.mRNA.1.CDS.1 [Saccharomyces cerevisiae]
MTRMTLPVELSLSLTSLLQRVAEDLEYSELLDQAATFEDSTLRTRMLRHLPHLHTHLLQKSCETVQPIVGLKHLSILDQINRYRFSPSRFHITLLSATWTESPRWDFGVNHLLILKFNGRSFNVKH